MLRRLLSIITNRSKGILEPAYLHILKTAFLSAGPLRHFDLTCFCFYILPFYTIVTQGLFCYMSGLYISTWHM